MPENDINPNSLPEAEPKSRADKLAQRILDDHARQAERQRERAQERQHDSGPWWKHSIGFDPYQVTKWQVIAGPEPGYMPSPSMRQGAVGFYVHCKACNAEFESKGLGYCPACMALPSEERHAMKPAFSGRMCQGPGCEQAIPRTARAGSMYCSPACRQRGARARNVTDNPPD